MTKEEIKETIPMKEVLSRYGIHVDSRNFCVCPFHNEKTPSMRVWKDHAFCYGECYRRYDQIDFVQEIEHTTFKGAIKLLGGDDELTMEQQERIAEARRKAKLKAEKELVEKHKRLNISCIISACREIVSKEEPYSDLWCFAQNKLAYAIGEWEEDVIKQIER